MCIVLYCPFKERYTCNCTTMYTPEFRIFLCKLDFLLENAALFPPVWRGQFSLNTKPVSGKLQITFAGNTVFILMVFCLQDFEEVFPSIIPHGREYWKPNISLARRMWDKGTVVRTFPRPEECGIKGHWVTFPRLEKCGIKG